jgi:hypothetical protein
MKKIVPILATLFLAFACQKVIDVDLNDANQTVVLEANYTAEDSTVLVKVTLTSSYFDSEASPQIDNAIVSITDANGVVTTVPSIGNGSYQLTGYAPSFGSSYIMNVIVNGTSYSATCALPTPVQIDPITYDFTEGFFGSGPGYFAFLNFQDPANVENYYQIVLSRNGQRFDRIDEIQTQDDLFTDGNYVQRPLFFDSLSQIGDEISFELRSVDKAVYDYTNEAASISGGTNSAAPGNPTTNWDNGALGYFNAFGVSRDTVVIQ